jgi:hypothetical protein
MKVLLVNANEILKDLWKEKDRSTIIFSPQNESKMLNYKTDDRYYVLSKSNLTWI